MKRVINRIWKLIVSVFIKEPAPKHEYKVRIESTAMPKHRKDEENSKSN